MAKISVDLEAFGLLNSSINLSSWGLGYMKMEVLECVIEHNIDRTDSKTATGELVGTYLYTNETYLRLSGVKFKYNPSNDIDKKINAKNNATILASLILLQKATPLPISLPTYFTGICTIDTDSLASAKGGDEDIEFSITGITPIQQKTNKTNVSIGGF